MFTYHKITCFVEKQPLLKKINLDVTGWILSLKCNASSLNFETKNLVLLKLNHLYDS